MSELLLGLDQGTSSTRALVLDGTLAVRGAGAVPVAAAFPAAGRVEQDPLELVGSAREAARLALARAGAAPGDLAAVGIANQTETFLICEREGGRPIHPAIVWQDRRTAEDCRALGGEAARRVRSLTGLELDATFPATKIAWVLDAVPGAREAAEAGALEYHDVGGWLVRSLTGGRVCEASNAGRTLLCRLGAGEWDAELLSLFAVPERLMAGIVASDAIPPGDPVWPVRAVLGDQQASLLGLGCHRAGMAKVTLGTGAFVLVQVGANAPTPPPGVLASLAWRRSAGPSFALEGFVPAAGAALTAFAELGLLPAPAQLDGLLASAGPEDGAVVCVPALQGLGTPSWDADARGALLGVSRATTRAQVARAVLDGVLHQVADALEAIAAVRPVRELLLDGGMSRSDWVVGRLAELAGVVVRRAAHGEATALGAATLAGLAAGMWGDPSELPAPADDLLVEPRWSADERAAHRARWADAVALATRWTASGPQ